MHARLVADVGVERICGLAACVGDHQGLIAQEPFEDGIGVAAEAQASGFRLGRAPYSPDLPLLASRVTRPRADWDDELARERLGLFLLRRAHWRL